jgi:hypothetical protein
MANRERKLQENAIQPDSIRYGPVAIVELLMTNYLDDWGYWLKYGALRKRALWFWEYTE